MAPGDRGNMAVQPPNTDPVAASVSNPDSPDYDRHNAYYDSTLDPTSSNYIHREGTVDTGQNVRGQTQRDVTAEDAVHAGDYFGLQQLIDLFTRNGRISSRYSDSMSAQAQQLAGRVETRPAPAFDAVNYNSYEHEQLRSMVKD